VLLVAPSNAQQPIDVTLIQLIATPEKFDGKLIRVIGFLRLEFEGNVLYLHRKDYENALLGNGIWVDVTPAMMKRTATLNTSYVLLEGVFSSGDQGHIGMWSSALKQARRAERWAFGNRGSTVDKQSR
jgi:hypothetical protein